MIGLTVVANQQFTSIITVHAGQTDQFCLSVFQIREALGCGLDLIHSIYDCLLLVADTQLARWALSSFID